MTVEFQEGSLWLIPAGPGVMFHAVGALELVERRGREAEGSRFDGLTPPDAAGSPIAQFGMGAG